MKTKVWIHSVLVALIAITVVLPLDCRKDEDNMPNPAENKQVEKVITAASGGVLTTSDSVKLVIPPYALPMDGKVFIGRTGNEPTSVPNKNLKIEGEPITVRFPSESLLKPVQLSIPLTSNSVDTRNYFVFLFNGSTYFPVEYSINGKTIIVSIDKIDWESTGKKNVKGLSEIIIIGLTMKQTPPEKVMGLKKVTINSITKEMSYNTPTANSSSKVLLLVHGWTGSPSTWEEFLPRIMSETNPSYSEYWTFGYNSSWSINQNGELLANLVKTHANGAQIDIVAHSMGGLVSRSMIEKFNGAPYIRKLITLGTPHEGSPLAVFRYVFGALVAMENPIESYIYNYFTQGFEDLNTDSKFIVEMKKLSNPPIPYYTVASTNDPNQSPFSYIVSQTLLSGLDDGIVQVSSAKGVQGAVSPSSDITIPVAWAHTWMNRNRPIYEQVLSFLRLGSLIETGTVTDIEGNIYKTVKIGSQWWMAENLKTTKYNDGTAIPLVTDGAAWTALSTPGYCWYNNDAATYKATYGALYSWYTVNTGKLCPTGWHVPTDTEWSTLTTYLGGESVAGGKLKETGTTHWFWPNTGATNKSGFTALPGGYRYLYGSFYNIGSTGGWWGALERDATSAWGRSLSYDLSSVYIDYNFMRTGFSVRCVKN